MVVALRNGDPWQRHHFDLSCAYVSAWVSNTTSRLFCPAPPLVAELHSASRKLAVESLARCAPAEEQATAAQCTDRTALHTLNTLSPTTPLKHHVRAQKGTVAQQASMQLAGGSQCSLVARCVLLLCRVCRGCNASKSPEECKSANNAHTARMPPCALLRDVRGHCALRARRDVRLMRALITDTAVHSLCVQGPRSCGDSSMTRRSSHNGERSTSARLRSMEVRDQTHHRGLRALACGMCDARKAVAPRCCTVESGSHRSFSFCCCDCIRMCAGAYIDRPNNKGQHMLERVREQQKREQDAGKQSQANSCKAVGDRLVTKATTMAAEAATKGDLAKLQLRQ